jgi:hypothetical protein
MPMDLTAGISEFISRLCLLWEIADANDKKRRSGGSGG